MKYVVLFFALSLPWTVFADDWPQWAGSLRDGVWRETGIVERFPEKELKPRWRTAIGGGYAGPAVADGRVYVLDRVKDKDIERVLCLDAATGAAIWKHEYACSYKGVDYAAGPRATPTVISGKAYTLGVKGNLFCFKADTGSILWQKDYVKDFAAHLPTWGATSAPLVDGRQLIAFVGGKEGAAVVSFDKDTGKELWRSLELEDVGYSPPVIIEAGRTRQLMVWHGEGIASLDPATGRKYWEEPFHTTYGVSIICPVVHDDLLYISQYWNGPLVFKLDSEKPAASVLWRNKDEASAQETAINSLMCTPVIRDGHIYGVAGQGALRCIQAGTGERVWETYDATGKGQYWNAFLVPNGDRFFIHNEQGELIIAKLSPQGYEEISRAKLIKPTNRVNRRDLVWSHPAFANRSVYARNDEEIVCVSLAAE